MLPNAPRRRGGGSGGNRENTVEEMEAVKVVEELEHEAEKERMGIHTLKNKNKHT